MLYKKPMFDFDETDNDFDAVLHEQYVQGYSDGKVEGEREACKIIMKIMLNRLNVIRKELLNSKRMNKAKLLSLLDDYFVLDDIPD